MTLKQTLLNQLSTELILDLTAQLVALPTPNPPGNEKIVADFITARLSEWGLEHEVIPHPDPARPQVVAWLRGTGEGPTIILNGHMDTVGPGPESAWNTPPFEATRQGGRLYGRGTADMKGALACGLVILKTLHQAEQSWPGTLMFQAVMGEEMDEPGTRTLLQRGYRGDYALVMEPTALRIGPASRGVVWFKLHLSGPVMHCGLADPDTPDLLLYLSDLGHALHRYHQNLSQQTHPLAPSPSCRVSLLEGGRAHNDLLGAAMLTLDRRMLPGETPASVEAELKQILAQLESHHPAFDYRLEFVDWNEPVECPLDSPLVTALQANIQHIGQREPEIWGPPYGSDVRIFLYDAGIPTVNFGAGDYRVCHQPNEYVETEELLAAARITLGTVVDLLGGGPRNQGRVAV
jgi:succinyl-diaminopimelate desuccinylase